MIGLLLLASLFALWWIGFRRFTAPPPLPITQDFHERMIAAHIYDATSKARRS